MNLFDIAVERRASNSIKWNHYSDPEVIPLWVADMDFISPPPVMEALHQRVDHGVFGYTGAPASLIKAIIRHIRTRFGWDVDPRWLVFLPGLVTGLNVTCRAVGLPGESVLTTTPVYPPFLSAPVNMDRRLITSEMRCDEGQWVFDWEALESAVQPDTRLFIHCSPHNPTGRLWSREEMEILSDFCLRHALILCSDEIHADLILNEGGKHIPIASLHPDIAANCITLMAPSKTYNIPGLGCAYAVIPDAALRTRFEAAARGIVPHVNLFGYEAARAAYTDGGAWLAALLDYLRGNHQRVREAVASMPGLSMTAVEATYLAWIDARSLNENDPARFFEKAGVGLSDGREFGGEGFVRLNFACPRSLLDKALDRMGAAIHHRHQHG